MTDTLSPNPRQAPCLADAAEHVRAYEAIHQAAPSYYATSAVKLMAMMREVEKLYGLSTAAIMLGETPVVVYEMLPGYDASDEVFH